MRNALTNYDIEFSDCLTASWIDIKALWSLDTARPVRLVPKLQAKHVFLGLEKKMSVKLAIQVFWHSVHAGLLTYRHQNLLPKRAAQTEDFVKK